MCAAKDLRHEALLLPREDRAIRARDLIESLDDPPDEDADQAWLNEAERRATEATSGAVALEDWDVVRERIANKLRALRR